MNRVSVAAMLAASTVSVLLMTGCGSNPAPSAAAPSPTTKVASVAKVAVKPPNPVALLHKIKGCKVSPSEHVGTADVDTGGMTASCSFHGADGSGNSVYMHTFTTAAQQRILNREYRPDDSSVIVTGRGFLARLVGTMNFSNGYDFAVKPATLARELGGHVVKP